MAIIIEVSGEMNRHEKLPLSGEAKIIFGAADFQIIEPGLFVRCAVTERPIVLELLRYWNVEKQVAYRDAEAVRRSLLACVEKGVRVEQFG